VRAPRLEGEPAVAAAGAAESPVSGVAATDAAVLSDPAELSAGFAQAAARARAAPSAAWVKRSIE
jgi:hypothetical protein